MSSEKIMRKEQESLKSQGLDPRQVDDIIREAHRMRAEYISGLLTGMFAARPKREKTARPARIAGAASAA